MENLNWLEYKKGLIKADRVKEEAVPAMKRHLSTIKKMASKRMAALETEPIMEIGVVYYQEFATVERVYFKDMGRNGKKDSTRNLNFGYIPALPIRSLGTEIPDYIKA